MSSVNAGISERKATSASVEPVALWMKVVMLSGGLSVALVMTAISPVLPRIESALAQDAGDKLLVKMLIGAVGFAMMVGAPLAGFLMDRLGMRKVLVGAGLLYVLAGTAGLYLSDLDLLLGSRLLAGLAGAAWGTASMTLINTRFSGLAQAKWMGAHVSVAILGNLVLHPAAGGLGELGWRWPFLLHLLGLVAVFAALAGSDDRLAAARTQGETGEGGSLFTWFPWRYAALAVCIGSVTFLPTVYLPFVARQTGVDSPFIISTVGLADALLSAGMAFIFFRARKILSSPAAFVWSFSCTAFGLLIAGTASHFIVVLIGMGIFGLGLGWFVPNLMTAAGAVVSSARQGRTVGLIKSAHYSAAPIATILVEPIVRIYGPSSALLVVAALSAVLVCFFIGQIVRSGGRAFDLEGAPT